MGKELITGVIAAIVIAGIVGIILGVIAKASKKNN
jgi:VIT1/CCC1 family predicted Fe2+/Mn2+ transporter